MFKRLKIRENDINIFQLARRAKVNFLLLTSLRCDHNQGNFSDHNQGNFSDHNQGNFSDHNQGNFSDHKKGNVKSKQFFSAFLDGHVFLAHLIKKI